MVAGPTNPPQELLEQLRQLLLSDDRERHEEIQGRLEELEAFVKRDDFHEKLEPFLEEHLTYLQKNFPELFGKHLGTAIKVQIRESQSEIIDALYPIIGKLIGKFLRTEIERISEQIDRRLQDPFSFSSFKLRLKAFFTGGLLSGIVARIYCQTYGGRSLCDRCGKWPA